MFPNRTPQLHERRQAGPRSPLQPLIEQRRRPGGIRTSEATRRRSELAGNVRISGPVAARAAWERLTGGDP